MGTWLRLVFAPLVAGLLFLSPVSWAEIAVPQLSSHVTDTVGLLSPATKTSLEATLKSLESSKGSQVLVLIVDTTEGEAIEQFSIRVAEKWKIGRKKIDDGAILVVAKADRGIRIEVGYGLEGVLSDATCKQIIENLILPEFRQGNFDKGIQIGIEGILARLSGQELPLPTSGSIDGWIVFLVLFIILVFIVYSVSQVPQGKYYSSRRNNDFFGGSSGGGCWSGGGGFSGGGGSFGGGGASGKW